MGPKPILPLLYVRYTVFDVFLPIVHDSMISYPQLRLSLQKNTENSSRIHIYVASKIQICLCGCVIFRYIFIRVRNNRQIV